MLVKSCTVKPIYKDRGGFEDVYIQTCRTRLCYHITAAALYMISHHITDIMIGQTLQSMLVIIYRRHRTHASLDRRRWRAPRRISTRQHVATKKQTNRKTQTRWQSHTADGPRVDWVVIGFVVSSRHSQRRRDDLLLCKNVWDEAGRPSRLLQRCVCTVLGRSGAEWRKAPMQDGTVGGWASRG